MVVLSHAFESNYAEAAWPLRLLGNAFYYGRFGVDLFFVLSGFLITGILLDERGSPHLFRRFYVRRILRIFPLYYGVLFILLALTPWLHLHWHSMAWLFLFDLQNLRPAQVGVLMLSPTLGLYHFWSLAVEEQFYLLWPLAVVFVRDRRALFRLTLSLSAMALLARLVLLATGTGLAAIHVTTFLRADALLLGGALAMLFRSAHWPRVLRMAPIVCLAASALVLGSIVLLGQDPPALPTQGVPAAYFWLEGFRYSVLTLGFGGLLAWSLHPASWVSRAASLPVLRLFGRYSYGLYVLHVLVFGPLIPVLRTQLFAWSGSKAFSVAGAGILATALSLALAMLSYRFYEAPFLRLKRHVPYVEASAPRTPELASIRSAA